MSGMSVADVLAQMNPAATAGGNTSGSSSSARSGAISLPQALLPGSGSATAAPANSTATNAGSASQSGGQNPSGALLDYLLGSGN